MYVQFVISNAFLSIVRFYIENILDFKFGQFLN